MAKKVIQMYDKYKSTTKIYPKIIEECLPSDIVGKIEDATKVTANPTLAGTEADLTGLQVGDTKFKVGGGKQLYQHNIFCQFASGVGTNWAGNYNFSFTNDVSEKYTNISNALTALYSKLGDNNKVRASGHATFTSGEGEKSIISIHFVTNGTEVIFTHNGVSGHNIDTNGENKTNIITWNTNFEDDVVAL